MEFWCVLLEIIHFTRHISCNAISNVFVYPFLFPSIWLNVSTFWRTKHTIRKLLKRKYTIYFLQYTINYAHNDISSVCVYKHIPDGHMTIAYAVSSADICWNEFFFYVQILCVFLLLFTCLASHSMQSNIRHTHTHVWFHLNGKTTEQCRCKWVKIEFERKNELNIEVKPQWCDCKQHEIC